MITDKKAWAVACEQLEAEGDHIYDVSIVKREDGGKLAAMVAAGDKWATQVALHLLRFEAEDMLCTLCGVALPRRMPHAMILLTPHAPDPSIGIVGGLCECCSVGASSEISRKFADLIGAQRLPLISSQAGHG